jgi:hypothetical protein
MDFIVSMERYLTRIVKTLQRLAASHAVPAGSRKVTIYQSRDISVGCGLNDWGLISGRGRGFSLIRLFRTALEPNGYQDHFLWGKAAEA